MALIGLSYQSQFHLKVVQIEYDDVAHVITDGFIELDTSVPSGVGAGTVIYQQDGVDEYWQVKVRNTAPYASVSHVVEDPILPCDLAITGVAVVDAMNGNNGSLTVTATGSGTKRYKLDGGTAQVSNVFANVLPGPHVVSVTRTEDSCSDSENATVVLIPNLVATVDKTNLSANGSDDGTITVTIVQGSEDYDIDFVTEGVVVPTDGAAPTVRVGLAPDTYDIEITDNVTGQVLTFQVIITEPAAPEQPLGTILYVPELNAIKAVNVDANPMQGLDNTLLCNQRYGNYQAENYFQPYNIGDKPKIQFFSNFSTHVLQLKNFATDDVEATYGTVKKVDNLNATDTFNVTLVEGDPGQTLVYFDTAELPLPIVANDVFTLAANVDFDGTYAVLAVGLDEDDNSQYLIIDKAFGAPASTVAEATFKSGAFEYDVFEAEIDFNLVAKGQYYLELTGSLDGNPDTELTIPFEPVDVQEEHEDTLLIVYSNYDNAFGIDWSTGYIGFMRVAGLFGHKRTPGGERTISREADFSITKISARKTRNLLLELFNLSPYRAEQLSVIFDCDVFSINNVPCQSGEGLQIENLEQSIMVNANILIEQLNWFTKYNSNDDLMASVTDSADCACDEIDLALIAAGAAASTRILDFAGKRQRIFKIQPSFADNRTIALADNSLALSFRLLFEISVGVGQYLAFPANFKSNAVPIWDNATKRLNFIDPGVYVIEATFDGTNWNMTLTPGVFS